MNSLKIKFSAVLTIAFLFISVVTQANAQGRINEREINTIITRLNVKLDDFRYGIDSGGNRNPVSQNDVSQLTDYLNDLKSDVESFQGKLDDRNDSQEDVRQILESARSVNDYTTRLRLTAAVQNDWRAARNLLDQLAGKYNVSSNWNNSGGGNYPSNPNYPNTNSNYPNSNIPSNGNFNNGLTGTYQLDTSRSENVNSIASDAINNIDPQRREDARRDLEQKLQSPDQLAIDLNGSQVTIASTLASQITFTANGTDRTETLPDGSTLRIRATLRGQALTVASLGGTNDYTVTFTPTDNGRGLKVTRRVTTDYLRQTVFAESVYTKTDSVARLDSYNNQNNYPPTNTSGNYPTNPNGNYPPTTRQRTGQFVVPNGTILTGILDNPMVSTKISQNNDPFRLKVQAPNEYRGAIVEGYLSGINSSGRVSGRSQLTFNFERITMPDGRTYDFAGFLQSVTNEKGETIKVDTEGAAKGGNQTKTTAIRSGIGAGLGAVIGAIAGGGKGAAIGAIIGGGAGAGSVFIQNNGDLELKQGSSFTFQSSSPIR